MTGKMWPLRSFRYDEQIDAEEVYLSVGPGEPYEPMTRDAALALARGRGLNLVAAWPEGGTGAPSCVLAKVSLPVRWERLPESDPLASLDDRLWFEAPCGGRDLLTGTSGHTHPGRMSAWCPQKQISYNVSLSEMGEMSEQSRYFVAGFLAGNAPDAPDDAGQEIEPHDLTAWLAAVGRFRRTGFWLDRWNICQECGCVLLPDTAADRCAAHMGR